MKNVIKLCIITALLASCEDVIDLDVPIAEPRLVIDASINYSETEDIQNYIKLYLTTPFFDETEQPVTNADVKLIDETNNVEYQFTNEFNNALYSSDFVPEFNTDYKLQIIYNNETYESVLEQLIPTAPLNELVQGDGTLFDGTEKEILIEYQDDEARNDYYLFDLDFELYLTSEDEFYQGNLFSFSYFYEDLNPGDEVTIKLIGINQRHYNFMNILLAQSENSGNPFGTTPTTVRGNVTNITNSDNFPLGYFRLSEISQQTIILE